MGGRGDLGCKEGCLFEDCLHDLEVRSGRPGIDSRSDPWNRLVGLVVKASATSAEEQYRCSNPTKGFFPGRVVPLTSKLALQWLPCQALGVTGSALGLIGPVSVYCGWMR